MTRGPSRPGDDVTVSASASGEFDSAPQIDPAAEIDVLFVAGMSGAGRGTVAKLLEDLGWYVADNVPPSLIANVVAVARADDATLTRMALVMRSPVATHGGEFDDIRGVLEQTGAHPRLLFLDADDAALVRRFEQVRRRHPMQGTGTLMHGITRERALLQPVSQDADLVVDTSTMSVTALREVIDNAFAQPSSTDLRITVQSFGFKYGLPIDADLVADVRFLPNPYWVPELREQTGLDGAVSEYVVAAPGAHDWLESFERVIRLTATGYAREGKRYMTVAVGCTGGKHRSVAMSEQLSRRLSGAAGISRHPVETADRAVSGDPGGPDRRAFATRVLHRDLGRE